MDGVSKRIRATAVQSADGRLMGDFVTRAAKTNPSLVAFVVAYHALKNMAECCCEL
ncbi:hypothetical protein D3C80_2115550 [compost metagenome]